MSTQLALYEHARDALAEAVRFDEVTRIHSAAEQAKAYARIAKDKKLLADAAELVARAERKLGIMLRKVKEGGLLSKGGRPAETSNLSEPETGASEEPVFDNTPFTLADIGIDKKLSSRAQKAAALDEGAFEDGVKAERERILADAAPVVSPPKQRAPKVAEPSKVDPVRPLEPRRWHKFAFSIIALTMASDRVSSEAIHKLAEHCGVVTVDGDEVDFTPEAIEAMGSLATAALKALDGGESIEPREPHSYSHDERYQRAVEIVRKDGETTTALLQRELMIGFNLASRVIDWMLRDGVIVSAGEGSNRWLLVEAQSESVPLQQTGDTSGASAVLADESDEGAANAPGAAEFLERARLREAYEGEVALLAPQKGKLTMKLAEAAMRAGYAAEVPLTIMVDDLGHPHGTIATWANRLGLTSAARMHATQQRFGEDA